MATQAQEYVVIRTAPSGFDSQLGPQPADRLLTNIVTYAINIATLSPGVKWPKREGDRDNSGTTPEQKMINCQ
jgi:hypothetical protein